MEIEAVGTKYVIRVEMRELPEEKKTNGIRHIVAKKDAIIREVVASKGEIVRRNNDYVKAGDVVISGEIKLNDEVKNKAGEYEVIVRVYDRANNFAKKKIKVVVKNRPVESISEQQTSENNNSFSSTTNSNTNTSSDNKNNASPSDNANSSSQEKTPVSSNPSQYNKYFSGNSIDSYNSACDYAESIYSSGKVKGYEVMPDGNGFNVIFS